MLIKKQSATTLDAKHLIFVEQTFSNTEFSKLTCDSVFTVFSDDFLQYLPTKTVLMLDGGLGMFVGETGVFGATWGGVLTGYPIRVDLCFHLHQ